MIRTREMVVGANVAMEKYLDHLGAQRFEEAAAELRKVQRLLNRMAEPPVN